MTRIDNNQLSSTVLVNIVSLKVVKIKLCCIYMTNQHVNEIAIYRLQS